MPVVQVTVAAAFLNFFKFMVAGTQITSVRFPGIAFEPFDLRKWLGLKP